MKKMLTVKGAGTALITPLYRSNGSSLVDYRALDFLVARQIKEGINFLVPVGTTGESPTLSHAEHQEVIAHVVKAANGQVPVLAGTGSNSTVEAVSLTGAAKDFGADGALVVAPYYNKPTQEGFVQHYRAVAQVGLPVVLYDIPGRCGGQGVSAQTILKLAHEGTICGLKWASGSLDQLMDVVAGRPKGFLVYSGDDNLTFPAMCLGADGVISVLSNLVPGIIANLADNINVGNWRVGRRQHYWLLRLMRAMFIETNPIPVKTALAMMYPRIVQEVFRLPMCPMDEKNRGKLQEVLRAYGLISRSAARHAKSTRLD